MLALPLIKSPKNSARGPLVILMLVAFVAFSAPFLFGYGTAPLTNFAGEIVSASGFATLVLVAVLYGNFEIAHRHIGQFTAALLLLILTTLAQYLYFGSINTAAWMIALGYIVLGWIAAWTGSAARSGPHADDWIKAICIGLAIGATIAALGSIAQFFSLDGGFIVLSPAQESGRTFGFVRQPNHQGTFLNIGLASIVYLISISSRRSKAPLLLAVLIIVFAILTTGSRTALIQVFFLSIFTALTFKSRGYRVAAGLLLLTITIWATLYALNYFEITKFYGAEKVTQTSSEGIGIRSKLWSETWSLIAMQPITGAGLLYYGSDLLLSGSAGKVGLPMTHSHNFILQILYAFGIPVACAFFLLIFKIFLDIRKNILNKKYFLFICIMACIGIHSMVEFPLWYTYFLLPFCFCVGWIEKRKPPSSLEVGVFSNSMKYTACIIGICAMALVVWINDDYYKITPIYTAGLKSTLVERVEVANRNFWFQPFSKFIKLNRQPVNYNSYQSYLSEAATNGCIMFELWYQPGTVTALTYAEKLNEAKWIIYSYWKLSGGHTGHFRASLESSDAPSKKLILDFIENPYPVDISTGSYEAFCFNGHKHNEIQKMTSPQ